MFDQYEPEDDNPLPRVRCRTCGKPGLAWEQDDDGKFILFNAKTSEVHKCAPDTGAFEDLSK